MIDEDAQDILEMLGIEDQKPIETLRANGPHKPLRGVVKLRLSLAE